MSTGDEDMSFPQLSSLDEKLDYAKQLNKRAEFNKALEYYKQLQNEFEKQKAHEKVMDCLSGICQSLSNLGRIHEMESYLNKYRSYCERYGDEMSKWKLNSFIGYISASNEDFQTAVEYYENALEISLKSHDVPRIIFLLINLQNVFLEIKDIGQALNCSSHLKKLYRDNQADFTKLSHCAYLLNYMTVLIELNNLEQIPNLISELEQIEGYEKLKREQMYVAYIKGKYFELKNDPKKALEYYDIAYSFLKETKEAPYYKQVVKQIIYCNKLLKNYEKASVYADYLIAYLENTERIMFQKKTLELSKKMKLDEMQSLIYFDSLTNVHNRRYLEVQGAKWIAQAKAENSEIACAIVDIDHFKVINDTYGHTFGDEVIKCLAKHLEKSLQDDMFCVRYGGDEFIVLARHKHNYIDVFQTIYDNIKNLTISHEQKEIPINVSIGVGIIKDFNDDSLIHIKGASLIQLIEEADKALYKIKNTGKGNINFNI